MFITLKSAYLGQQAGTRLDVDSAVAEVLISKGIAEKAADNALEELVTKSAEGLMGRFAETLEKTVSDTVKAFGDALVLSRKGADRRIFGENEKGDRHQTFGAFLTAVCKKDMRALEAMGAEYSDWDSPVTLKADMNTNTGTQGGFLVPTQHYDDISMRVSEMSIVRQYARIIDMTGRMVEVPTPNITTAPSAGDSASLSGLVMRWTEEGADKNQTEPTLKQVKLSNYELSGYSEISSSLMQDAPGLESFLKSLFAEGVAWNEDYAFLRGNGVGKPLGMVTWVSNNSFTQSRSAASAVALTDIANLEAKFLEAGSPMSRTFYAIHPTVKAKLLSMVGGDQVLFLGNDLQGRPVWQILGRTVHVTEKLPALNTAGDILLANGNHYYIGDRKRYEVKFSEHVNIKSNQVVFVVVSRVGGQPCFSDKMTLADASSTLGSFVTLTAG